MQVLITILLCSEHALCWWSFSHFIDGRQRTSVLSEWAHWNNGETGSGGTLSSSEISYEVDTKIIRDTGEIVSHDLPILKSLNWLLPLQLNILCIECVVEAAVWWSTWNYMHTKQEARRSKRQSIWYMQASK